MKLKKQKEVLTKFKSFPCSQDFLDNLYKISYKLELTESQLIRNVMNEYFEKNKKILEKKDK